MTLAALALAGCTDAASTSVPPADAGRAPASSEPERCPTFAAAAVSGHVTAPAIIEASGLVASRQRPGVLYTHNDSGDEARLFALHEDGTLAGTIAIEGATARDWEALAAGPSESGPALFIGDIGDNDHVRTAITVYVVPEPPPDATRAVVERRIDLRYEDGAHDAEALLVDPASGEITIVTKSADGVSGVYVAAAPVPSSALLHRVSTLTFGAAPLAGNPRVTDGSVSRSGDLIALRTYDTAFVWRRRSDMSIAATLGSDPCPVPVAVEPQGEAIAFAADGSGYFTLSEKVGPTLWFFAAQ